MVTSKGPLFGGHQREKCLTGEVVGGGGVYRRPFTYDI